MLDKKSWAAVGSRQEDHTSNIAWFGPAQPQFSYQVSIMGYKIMIAFLSTSATFSLNGVNWTLNSSIVNSYQRSLRSEGITDPLICLLRPAAKSHISMISCQGISRQTLRLNLLIINSVDISWFYTTSHRQCFKNSHENTAPQVR